MRLLARMVVLAFTSSLVLLGLAGSQVPNKKPPAALTSAPPVIVEAISLTLNPASPKVGQQTTITFTIKNAGTAMVPSIPWTIHNYTQNITLKTGAQSNVAAGGTFVATTSFTPTKTGPIKLQGYVDPNNTLKNKAPAGKQTVEANINVLAGLAVIQGAQVQLEEQWLNWTEAKNAGARFNHNIDPGPPIRYMGVFPCSEISQESGLAECPSPGDGQSAVFLAYSQVIGLIVQPGAIANPEAFVNCTLKNNWRIKAVDVFTDVKYQGDWSWTTRPSEGSNSPYMKMHLWVNPGGSLVIKVKVRIIGPAGTSPYHY